METKKTIFDIVGDFQALDDLLDEAGGDVSEEQTAQAVEEFLAELQGSFEDKADGYARVIDDFKGRSATLKAEADRCAAMAKAEANKAKRLAGLLEQAMRMTGQRRIKTALHVFAIQKHGGKRKLDIHAPCDVPWQFVVTKKVSEISKDAIRAAIEAGQVVPGCILMEQGESLRIR